VACICLSIVMSLQYLNLCICIFGTFVSFQYFLTGVKSHRKDKKVLPVRDVLFRRSGVRYFISHSLSLLFTSITLYFYPGIKHLSLRFFSFAFLFIWNMILGTVTYFYYLWIKDPMILMILPFYLDTINLTSFCEFTTVCKYCSISLYNLFCI